VVPPRCAVMSAETVAGNSSADAAVTVTMSLLTAVAIAGNLSVLGTIVRSPSLRVQLTNFFVINLCVVDLVAATVVMPMSVVSVNSRSSSTNTTLSGAVDDGRSLWCTVFRLLSTFVVFASVLSIAVANVERYVSIRHPMLHAAQLTVGRTLLAIVSVWAAAVAVAATPVAADWDVLDTGTRCCAGVAGLTPPAAAGFVIVVLALLFVAPTFMMAAMCCSIYRVARQAGRQVVPGVNDLRGGSAGPTQPTQRSSSTVSVASCTAAQSSLSCPTLNSIHRHNDVAKSVICERRPDLGKETDVHPTTSPLPAVRDAPECVIRITCHEDVASTAAVTDHPDRRTVSSTSARTVEAQLSAGVVADRPWKAAATLLFILLTFVPLWSPYFAYSLYRAVERNQQASQCGSAYHVETAVVWIGFVTFASNAFVYGWMNRAIRDALRDALEASCGSCTRGRARLSQVLGAGDAEDFFQFLERTSNFDRAQSLTQSSTASVELTAVNQARP